MITGLIMETRDLLILFSLLTSSALFGQGNGGMLVSNAAVHVLYRGYDNPVQVSVPGVSFEDVSVECADATVRKDATEQLWYIMPTDSTVSRVRLKVFKTTNRKKELMKEQICAAVDRSAPTIVGLRSSITLATKSGGTSSQNFRVTKMSNVPRRSLLSKGAELVADYPTETMQSVKLTIGGFCAQIRQTKFECVGNRFSDEATQAIAQLKSGDRIYITDIRATDEAGKEVLVTPCTITIR